MRRAHEQPAPGPAARYEIRVRGRLDESWSEWLGGLTVEHEGDVTMLSGMVADQAALRGALTRLWDLNLTLLAVVRMDPGHGKEAR